MCLARSAHGMVPNHSIFQGPFPVDMQLEEVPTPANYRRFPAGQSLGATMPVWHVDTTDYRSDKSLQPGTVAGDFGFLDSPDTEVISGGINSKGPGAVAIGRHASFFLWGFAAEPSRMTASGRNAFLNSICYAQRFDHEPMLVRRQTSSRDWTTMRAMQDPAAFAKATADLEFVRGEGRKTEVDADCKALGLSNRSVALLEHCIAAWERGEDVERAQRLLRRYTDRDFASAAEWRAWFAANQANLFFSDLGGYRFYVRPLDVRSRVLASAPPATSDEAPAGLAMSILDESVQPGSIVTIAVRFAHAPGWHTYASVPADSPYRPTGIQLELPEGWAPVGRWSLPATTPSSEDPRVRTVTGDAVYLQRVRVAVTATAGPTTLRATVGFMVCDEQRCLPPAEEALQATVLVGAK